MRIACIKINNFRGIQQATVFLPKHGVLVGDNNTGKTTILEALDLVLGPDRLNRNPPIDEHDFFRGIYTNKNIASSLPTPSVDGAIKSTIPNSRLDTDDIDEKEFRITIEVTIVDLNLEQKSKLGDYVEFWDIVQDKLYNEPIIAGLDADSITEALRVTFHGWYNKEEDDFEGRTYFTRSLTDEDKPVLFSKKHKQLCGFLYLRSLRTGSRALSLERGSLLDIILRIKEVRPQMWEDAIDTLCKISVASSPDLGLSPVLESINEALKKYVPKEWGVQPHLKISNLTREHLRKIITAFIATGDGVHAAPFYRQGTGTINMLVLAMLSQIAESKHNVVFAMEEPETAIPPYAQKRIVHEVRKLASQTLFTSHSPYVLEEFAIEETIVLARNSEGTLERQHIELPENVKQKRYRQEFRTRFCEGLLSRRILIAEGPTEAAAFPVACRRLAELNPLKYSPLEALGVCTVDADGEKNIPGMAKLYRTLGKRTFAICDNQEAINKKDIEENVDLLLMHSEKGFENLVFNGTSDEALKRFSKQITWPQHLLEKYPSLETKVKDALADYFRHSKGSGSIADFLTQCTEDEIPEWLRNAAIQLKTICCSTDPSLGCEVATLCKQEGTSEVTANGID